MSKRAEDPLVPEIRMALMPGRFVRWNEVSGMVSNLERVQERVETLVKTGEAGRAVRLYEIFLSEVYAKIEEADLQETLGQGAGVGGKGTYPENEARLAQRGRL